MKMKFSNQIFLIIGFVSIISTTNGMLLTSLLANRRSRDVKLEDGDVEHSGGVMDLFGTFFDDIGLKNTFRDVKVSMLGASEKLLEQSTNIYDTFQETLAQTRSSTDERSSEFRKALRYLQTEARRRREDIEDEIEIEKEKLAEAETKAEKKESKQKLNKLQEALKQMDEVAKTRINKVKDKIKQKRSNRKSLLKNRRALKNKEKVEIEKEDESKRSKRSTDKNQSASTPAVVAQPPPAKDTGSSTSTDGKKKTKGKSKVKNINPDAVQSAGDGFGDH